MSNFKTDVNYTVYARTWEGQYNDYLSEPEWVQVGQFSSNGQPYFQSLDAESAAKYVAKRAAEYHKFVKIVKTERIRTLNEEEISFDD